MKRYSIVEIDRGNSIRDEFLYAFCMDAPNSDIRITSLGTSSKLGDKKIAAVKLLGSNEKLQWKQEAGSLVITKPSAVPAWKVMCFKIELK